MKKLVRISLIIITLAAVLAVTALAESSVVENGTENWSYTATLDGNDGNTPTTISEDDMYVLIVIKTSSLDGGGFPTALTADDIIYIDQKTATADDEANNTITFADFIPMNYSGGTAFITGGSLAGPVAIGTLDSHGIFGDVNGDLNINATDAVLVLRHSSGIITLDSNAEGLGDVNGDTNTNATDAVLILRRSSGIISSFPVE